MEIIATQTTIKTKMHPEGFLLKLMVTVGRLYSANPRERRCTV
jgi:hypothetical protein